MNQPVKLFSMFKEKIRKIKQTTKLFEGWDNQKICVAEYQLQENLVKNCNK